MIKNSVLKFIQSKLIYLKVFNKIDNLKLN